MHGFFWPNFVYGCENTLQSGENLVYIQYTESGIYKCLLHMGLSENFEQGKH